MVEEVDGINVSLPFYFNQKQAPNQICVFYSKAVNDLEKSTSTIAVRTLELQLTVGTFGTIHAKDCRALVTVFVVAVTVIHVFTDGTRGTGTLMIWGFTIGPQTVLPL